MSLPPSTRLGPYEIVSPLGAGGMGEVYRARDTRLGREVAVKVLPEALTSAPEVRARFEREAPPARSHGRRALAWLGGGVRSRAGRRDGHGLGSMPMRVSTLP